MAIIEKTVGINKLLSFVVQNTQDADYIKKIFRDRNLLLDVYIMKNCQLLQPMLHPSVLTQLSDIGIQGYLGDSMECPDIIRYAIYLCFLSVLFRVFGLFLMSFYSLFLHLLLH